ncbi:hypothetical protein D9757_000474 [Collybiopsis confluens]|uniref:ABC transporter domain-containing protein n=1 Tax=Collybiopsis confluens TaxID=2823264 RepID=A0A8H5I1S6_9AGAR|nr:hypothetical protein D9757_000474 [Collybiopsis confluens]
MTNIILASSQQTRFHIANSTVSSLSGTSSSSQDLDIPGVSVSISNSKGPEKKKGSKAPPAETEKEILSDAHLKLSSGVRYALVGRNGVGKSTLLRAIGEKLIPGIPLGMRIVVLQQSYDKIDDIHTIDRISEAEDISVMDFVISSDHQRMEALRRQKQLQQALENTQDPTAAVQTLRQFKLEDDLRILEEAKKTANLRSGSRGMAARKELKVIESRVEEKQSTLDVFDSQTLAHEMNEAIMMLTDIENLLEEMSPSAIETRAKRILRGLGFKLKSSPTMTQSMSSLSGGWQMRVHLASVLFRPSDILLLDEPTNFLDLPSLLWLESYLQNDHSPNTTVLFVSHDRTFTDSVAEEVLVLRDLKLERFPGNLTAYEETRSERQRYLSKMADAQSKQRSHIQETIAGNIRQAKSTGDDKKLRQAASRQKKLDDRMGLEVGLRGGRFKLNRDLAGYHLTSREGIEGMIPKDEVAVKMVLPREPGEELRFPGPLISVEGLRFVYRNAKTSGVGGKTVIKETLNGINLVIHPKSRVGIVGLNGAGKSTLIRCLVGRSNEGGGRVIAGTVKHHPAARMGFFSQDAIEKLPLDKTALQLMMDVDDWGGDPASVSASSQHEARSILASVGLTSSTVSSVPISRLSGGQKVRLTLALMLYPPPKLGPVPHVLILDEVTTHLDADTVVLLAEELKKFAGALVVVSHDRWFVRNVVELDGGDNVSAEDSEGSEDEVGTEPGVVYEIDQGKLVELKGGIGDFEKRLRSKKAG